MKLLTTALIILGLSAQAQSPVISSQILNLNQGTQSLNLESKTFETIYRTDQVPDTCYRSEVQGTRPECHTEYDHQCHTEYRQFCEYRYFPVCQTVPRPVCYPQQVCRTVQDSVCNSHGCVMVPRQVCQIENRCTTQMDQVCHNESRYVCETRPQTSCQDIPHQACINVPNVVQVPYSCMKPVQVAIGQELKLHTAAQVTVNLVNFNEVGPLNETLTAKLDGDQVLLTSKSQNYLFQVVDQQRTEQTLSATEKTIQVTFSIKATSIAKLNEFSMLQINNGKIGFDRIGFSLSQSTGVAFKGHLTLSQRRTFGKDLVLVDRDFDSRLVVSQGTDQILMLNGLGSGQLKNKHHFVKLSLSIDGAPLRKGAINPEALNSIKNIPIESQFEGNPQ